MSNIISNAPSHQPFLQNKRGREDSNQSSGIIIKCTKCEIYNLRKLMKQCAKCNNFFCSSCQIQQTAINPISSWACCFCSCINRDNCKINLHQLPPEIKRGILKESKTICEICDQETSSFIQFSTVNEVFDYLKSKGLDNEVLLELSTTHSYDPPRIICKSCLSRLLIPPKGSFSLFLSVFDIIHLNKKSPNQEKSLAENEEISSTERRKIFSVEKLKKKKRHPKKVKDNHSSLIETSCNITEMIQDPNNHQSKKILCNNELKEETDPDTSNNSNSKTPSEITFNNNTATPTTPPTITTITTTETMNNNINTSDFKINGIKIQIPLKQEVKVKRKEKQKIVKRKDKAKKVTNIIQSVQCQDSFLVDLNKIQLHSYGILLKHYDSFSNSLKQFDNTLRTHIEHNATNDFVLHPVEVDIDVDLKENNTNLNTKYDLELNSNLTPLIQSCSANTFSSNNINKNHSQILFKINKTP